MIARAFFGNDPSFSSGICHPVLYTVLISFRAWVGHVYWRTSLRTSRIGTFFSKVFDSAQLSDPSLANFILRIHLHSVPASRMPSAHRGTGRSLSFPLGDGLFAPDAVVQYLHCTVLHKFIACTSTTLQNYYGARVEAESAQNGGVPY